MRLGLQLKRGPSGNLDAATGWLEDEPHPDAKAGEHIDQGVGAEQVDAAAQEMAHPRLGYPENRGRLGLLQMSRGDDPLELDHEVGTDQQMLGFLRREAEIAEDIAARRSQPGSILW